LSKLKIKTKMSKAKEPKEIKDIAKEIVEVVNKATNDYDARDLVEKELWDHYSGLPNPNWYKQNKDEE
tara:strand:- start:177 stop:380 length:204 start_codon:yes stop_codon:yes gene_type:complete